jgi:hypothetical protein
VRGWKDWTVREIASLFSAQRLTVCLAYNHNQPGDPTKGANIMIDVVKGEGAVKDKEFTPVVLLGSDCYDRVRGILTKAVTRIDEWKDITTSTDRDDL